MSGSEVVALAAAEVWYADNPPVLGPIDLTIRAGEHWALLGPNGAGKSTLLALAGARRFPSAGTVRVLGRRLGRVDVRDLRTRIGVVDPAARIPPWIDVAAYLATGLSQTVQPRSDGPLSHRESAAAARAAAAVGVEHLLARTVSNLSAGERARARLARGLIGDPPLLLLDEPAAGLDLPGRGDLLDALETLAIERRSLTSVTVAHHLEELPGTMSHVALLRAGALLAAGDVGLLHDAQALQRCFGRPMTVATVAGRWVAVATAR